MEEVKEKARSEDHQGGKMAKKSKGILKPKRITARQRNARRKNMAIARMALKKGLKTSRNMRKASLKFKAKGRPGDWSTLNAKTRLHYGRY